MSSANTPKLKDFGVVETFLHLVEKTTCSFSPVTLEPPSPALLRQRRDGTEPRTWRGSRKIRGNTGRARRI